jgi:hypothetical protein
MNIPIALLAIPEEKIVDKILTLREDLLKDNKVIDEEIHTVPHLTLAVSYAFPEDLINHLEQTLDIMIVDIEKFTLRNLQFDYIDGSIAAKFDQNETAGLVEKCKKILSVFSTKNNSGEFRPIYTWYIKVLRKTEVQLAISNLEIVQKQVPNSFRFEKIALAWKELKKEDIIWEKLL